MSALEQLRPFFSLCQATGFIPFFMKTDKHSKRLISFVFSCSSLVTWWFILITILQVGFPIVTIQLIINGILSTDEETPVTVKFLIIVTFCCYMIQLVTARYVILRHYSRLRNAVQLALQLEELFQTNNVWTYSNSINRRFIIGVLFLALSVEITIFLGKAI